MKHVSFVLRAAVFSFVVALLVVTFSPRAEEVEASHVDTTFINEPPTWYRFFEAYGGTHKITWQLCDFLPIFGFGPNAESAVADWESTHGYGIDLSRAGTCSSGAALKFKTLFGEECGPAPPGTIIGGCWDVETWSYFTGVPAAFTATIFINTLWYDASANSAQKTHLFAHELGHGFAVGHHFPCATVMAQGLCSNQVETSDVYVPRCLYGYTC